MSIREWATQIIRARNKDVESPFPLADMTMTTWPYVCAEFEEYERHFGNSSQLMDACKKLIRQVREEMQIPDKDFIVVTNAPFNGKFVIGFSDVTSAVQCRMICEAPPRVNITAGY